MADSTTLQKPISAVGMRGLMAYLLLCVAYIVSGKLGLMLALPPGYASPIFPPAGIAVAAVLIGGKKTLPWIFIGSLLLNIWVGYSSSGQINTLALGIASIIATASMLQAAIGGCGLRRMIGYPAALDNSGDVLRFLLTAPVICLTSATLSVGGLWALGVVDTADLATNWGSWWVGDTLGVIVMLPLAMTVAGEPRALWNKRIRSVAAPISLIFALFVLIFLAVNRWEYNDSLMEFRQLSQQAVSHVQNKLEEQEFLLEQTSALFTHDTRDRVTKEEFHRFVEKSLIRFPMIQALEWVSAVDAGQRAGFEAEQRKYLPGFEIRERNSAGKLVRAGARATYYPVTYIEPVAGNELALGFDLASNQKRLAALKEAMQCKTAVMTTAVHLVQERAQQAGMLLVMAVNPDDARSGAVLTVLRVGDFMDKLLKDSRPMLYTRLIDLDDRHVIYDNFAVASQLPLYQRTFEFGTRRYRIENAPTPLYFRLHHGWQSWSVLAAGILGTGLIGALLLLGTGYTARIETQVDQRTRELTESKKSLQEAQHLAQLGSWELDIVGNRLVWSDEIYRIFEIDAAVFGASYDAFLNAIHPEDRAMVDNAYAESVTQRKPYDIEHRLLFAAGRIKYVHERGETFYDSQGRAIRSAGTVQDITERKAVEEQIRNLAFYDALTQLPNRRLLDDRLSRTLAASRRSGCYGALMFLDLDNFKPLNDEYGHAVGDLLLIEVARRIGHCVREADTVARFGGDEFVVMLSELDQDKDESVAQAGIVAEKIRISLAHPYLLTIEPEGEPAHIVEHHCTSSIGVMMFVGSEAGQEDILKWADMAMYQAKQAGRNQIRFYDAAA